MPEGKEEQSVLPVFLDAGLFIGALLNGDSRHAEARPLVEQARRGELKACTTAGVLSEVYGALTWEKAEPKHEPAEAEAAVKLLVEEPSAIVVLNEGLEVTTRALELAEKYGLRARRIHDARHAAAALVAGVTLVYTYDVDDWNVFQAEGLQLAGPPTVTGQRST